MSSCNLIIQGKMAGSDILERPELDAMLERVKLTRGSDDKLSSEVCGVVEYLMLSVCYGYLFWFDLSGLTLTVILNSNPNSNPN